MKNVTWITLSLAAWLGACTSDGDGATTTTSTATTSSTSTTTSQGGGGAGGAGGGAAAELMFVVRGTLYTQNLTEAQGYHDGLAEGGEPAATAAGDFGHDALLGTTLLGTTANAFLGVDRWHGLEAATAFYSDPAFAAAFGQLFLAPPTVEPFAHRTDWHEWGNLDAADAAAERWFVVVRGRLASADVAVNQAAHDDLAAAGEAASQAAGDVAHVVGLGAADPQEFLAIDVWTSDVNIEAVYGDPVFQQAFASLFSAPATVAVYHDLGWYQW
ncbi:MAG: hypothetical protein HY908_35225 [Myxococcales bacterium]|nr:hypothetical protein [Myxococcales bacterium]